MPKHKVSQPHRSSSTPRLASAHKRSQDGSIFRLRLRATHEQMFSQQSASIAALKVASDANLRAHAAIRECIDAVSANHDEMAAFFAEVNDLDDTSTRSRVRASPVD